MRGSSINQECHTDPLLGRRSSNSFPAAPRHQSTNTFSVQALQSTRRINPHSSAAPPPQSGFVQPVSLRDPPAHCRLRPSLLLRDRAKKPLHCTQRFYATNVHKRPGSAVLVLKVTLTVRFQGSLPYIFPGLLPLPHNATFSRRPREKLSSLAALRMAPHELPHGFASTGSKQ